MKLYLVYGDTWFGGYGAMMPVYVRITAPLYW